jgi:hypothetical protein
MPTPSMLDGLHQKLLGNGLWAVAVLIRSRCRVKVLAVSRTVPAGKVSATTD